MEAILALRRRNLVQGRGRRRRGRSPRRGRVQHEHDRLPGSAHRPVVLGADRHDDVPGDRQLRRLAGRRRVARAAGGRLHRARGIADRQQLAVGRDAARLPRRQQDRRDFRHRHARAHPEAALGRRDARRHHDRQRPRSRRARRAGAVAADDGRVGPRAGRDVRGGIRLAAGGSRRVRHRDRSTGPGAA